MRSASRMRVYDDDCGIVPVPLGSRIRGSEVGYDVSASPSQYCCIGTTRSLGCLCDGYHYRISDIGRGRSGIRIRTSRLASRVWGSRSLSCCLIARGTSGGARSSRMALHIGLWHKFKVGHAVDGADGLASIPRVPVSTFRARG